MGRFGCLHFIRVNFVSCGCSYFCGSTMPPAFAPNFNRFGNRLFIHVLEKVISTMTVKEWFETSPSEHNSMVTSYTLDRERTSEELKLRFVKIRGLDILWSSWMHGH